MIDIKKLILNSPFLNLAFRPFFWLSAAFAALSISAWVLYFLGYFSSGFYMGTVNWHSHEMVYGYSSAVIAGFILTAARNWTGKKGISRMALFSITSLWVLARVLFLLVHTPSLFVFIIDISFFPALACLMIPYLSPSDMKVERVFFVFFGLYLFGNFLMHADAFGWLSGYSRQGAYLGLYTTLMMIVFMGGRVIPFFSESELTKKQPKVYRPIEILAHISLVIFLISQLLFQNSVLAAVLGFITGIIHLIRLSGWYVRRIRRVAILWILFISYFWIAMGFILSEFASLGLLSMTHAVHALTIGGIGMMTFGMMSRVALGHTGRKIRAPRAMVYAYLLLLFSTLIRVFGPILLIEQYKTWIVLSGSAWALAFLLFLIFYTSILWTRRVDGRPG